jgi:hypothetical protein
MTTMSPSTPTTAAVASTIAATRAAMVRSIGSSCSGYITGVENLVSLIIITKFLST